jgi:hypothetical protein
MVRQKRPEPESAVCSTRRRFVTGALGAALSAPAILANRAEAFSQTAQDGRNARDTGPRLALVPAGTWLLTGEIMAFRFSPDGNRVAVRHWDRIAVYEFPTGKTIADIPKPSPVSLPSFGFGDDGRSLIVSPRQIGSDRVVPTELVQVFDAASGRLLDRLAFPMMEGGAVFFADRVATSSDSRFAAIRVGQPLKRSAIVLLDTKDLSVRGVMYESAPGLVYRETLDVSRDGLVAVAENGASLMRANLPSNIAIVDPARNTRIADFPGTSEGTASLRWSPDGSLLGIGSMPLHQHSTMQLQNPAPQPASAAQEAVWIWELRERRTKLSLPLVPSPVRAAEISPDNLWFATRRAKYSRVLGSGVSVWRVSDGAEMFAYETPDARLISDVAFSPSGVNFAFVEGQAFKMFRVIS